eukprot:8072678-Heterocapsa_arctica.AAC.1
MPGGPYIQKGQSQQRTASNFCGRNKAVGRTCSDFNAVIILKPTVINDYKMTMSHNGIIATVDTISSRHIDILYIKDYDSE